jgi:hypothetical protein
MASPLQARVECGDHLNAVRSPFNAFKKLLTLIFRQP